MTRPSRAPWNDRCRNRNSDSCVIANTYTRSKNSSMFVTLGAASSERARSASNLIPRLEYEQFPLKSGVATEMSASPANSFGARSTLTVGDASYEIFRLDALQSKFDVARLPFSLKILLENLLRNEDAEAIRAQGVEALAGWDAKAEPSQEIAFTPARVVMQDFTGVPAIVDLAAMRDAMRDMGGDESKINPLVPAELVIDHSVQVDAFGTRDAFRSNAEREFDRNQERYAFLRWGQ